MQGIIIIIIIIIIINLLSYTLSKTSKKCVL